MKGDFSILGRNVNVNFSSLHISSAAVEKDTALNHAYLFTNGHCCSHFTSATNFLDFFFHFSVIWLNCFFSMIRAHKFLSSCLIDWGFGMSLSIHYYYIGWTESGLIVYDIIVNICSIFIRLYIHSYVRLTDDISPFYLTSKVFREKLRYAEGLRKLNVLAYDIRNA